MRYLGSPWINKLTNRLKKVTVTISLEGTSLRLMTVEGGVVKGWLSLPFNPRLVDDGRIEDPNRLAEVLKTAVGRVDAVSGKVLAAFPSSRATSRVITLPNVKGLNPKSAVPREANRIMGSAADYHHLFWTPLKSEGLELRYFLLAAPKGELVNFLQTLTLSGLHPDAVDTRALALARGVGVDSAIILNLENTGLDVLILSDYVPLIVTRRELRPGIGLEELLDEVIDEFQNTVEYYNDRNPAIALPSNTAVYLMGGHSLMSQELAEALRNRIGRNILFPSPEIDYPPEFPPIQYMVNVGLALKGK